MRTQRHPERLTSRERVSHAWDWAESVAKESRKDFEEYLDEIEGDTRPHQHAEQKIFGGGNFGDLANAFELKQDARLDTDSWDKDILQVEIDAMFKRDLSRLVREVALQRPFRCPVCGLSLRTKEEEYTCCEEGLKRHEALAPSRSDVDCARAQYIKGIRAQYHTGLISDSKSQSRAQRQARIELMDEHGIENTCKWSNWLTTQERLCRNSTS
jgi:hypothetical protein